MKQFFSDAFALLALAAFVVLMLNAPTFVLIPVAIVGGVIAISLCSPTKEGTK